MPKPPLTPDKATDSPTGSGASVGQKLDAKRTRAGIGDLVAGVSLTGPAANPFTSRGRDTAEGRTAESRGVKHPIGSGIAFERVEDVYKMDPKKIVMEGPYIRQFIEDSAFHQLRAAVRIERDIGQHIGVRIVGPPTDARRVLVYGMRRWRAALAEALEKVPVRDYGRISEEKAIELQMLENEIRADPHPIDTALGFYLLSRQDEWNQKRIAEVFDKNKGYVSEMVRVGEALAQLSGEERTPLYTAPRVTVRAFQSIAQVKDLGERRTALLALLQPTPDEAPQTESQPSTSSDAEQQAAQPPRARSTGDAQAERRREVDEAIFHSRPLRNGRSFRVRWTDDELKARAPEIIEEFRRHILEEYTHLLHRANVLAAQGSKDGEGQGTTPLDIATLVASVAKDVARVDARLGTTNAGAARGAARTKGAE